MPTAPRLLTPDARRTANRLPAARQRQRTADGAAVTEPSDSYEAFVVPDGWAQTSCTPVHSIVHTLLHGICEGDPQTEVRQRPLIPVARGGFRHDEPGDAQLPDGTGPSPTGT